MADDHATPVSNLAKLVPPIFILAAIGTIIATVQGCLPERSTGEAPPSDANPPSSTEETEDAPPPEGETTSESTPSEPDDADSYDINGFDLTVQAGANMEDVGPDKFEISRWIGHRSDLIVEWGGINHKGMPVDPGNCAMTVEVWVDGELFGQELSGDCEGNADFQSVSQPGTYEIRVNDETSKVSAEKSVTVVQTHERR